MTIPQGFDPIFPNKRVIGYDGWGKPIYDMAATGFRTGVIYGDDWKIVDDMHMEGLTRIDNLHITIGADYDKE